MKKLQHRLPPPIGFRGVDRADLLVIANWLKRGIDLGEARHEAVVASLQALYEDVDGDWRRHTRVMTAGGRPICMIEFVAGDLYMTSRPEVAQDAAASMAVWEKTLRYLFYEQGLTAVHISVPIDRRSETTALQRLGCRRLRNFTDSQGTHRRYVCRLKDLRRSPIEGEDL